MKLVVTNPFYNSKYANQAKYNYYEGESVAVPSWVDYPAIALKTGGVGKDFPIRIIPKEWVYSVDGTAVEYDEPKSTRREFKVTGSKGDIYTVTVDGKHKYCTCQAFMFRRNCKHIVGIDG